MGHFQWCVLSPSLSCVKVIDSTFSIDPQSPFGVSDCISWFFNLFKNINLPGKHTGSVRFVWAAAAGFRGKVDGN